MMIKSPLFGRKDTQPYELILEEVFGRPFGELLAEVQRTDPRLEKDLLGMGMQLFRDAVRLARGELHSVSVPRRLPRLGEYANVI